MAGDQDWRLRLELERPINLDGLLSEVRDKPFEQDARASLGDDVVLTHDGDTFFAYASSEQAIRRAREAIGSVLAREGRAGAIQLSHWDAPSRRWRQSEPPLSKTQSESDEAAEDIASDDTATRTVVCTIGRLIRKSFERQMVDLAKSLGLRCEFVEHPHLLSTQVAFNVTGRQESIAEFDRYLKSEARATTHVDPGLVPFGLP